MSDDHVQTMLRAAEAIEEVTIGRGELTEMSTELGRIQDTVTALQAEHAALAQKYVALRKQAIENSAMLQYIASYGRIGRMIVRAAMKGARKFALTEGGQDARAEMGEDFNLMKPEKILELAQYGEQAD